MKIRTSARLNTEMNVLRWLQSMFKRIVKQARREVKVKRDGRYRACLRQQSQQHLLCQASRPSRAGREGKQRLDKPLLKMDTLTLQ